MEPDGWIASFSRIVHLGIINLDFAVAFIPFHGFSPVIKSLHASFLFNPPLQIFDLILPFPLLENLAVAVKPEVWKNELLTTTQLLNLPPFTGSLELHWRGGIKLVARRLLSLPSGIRFRKLTLGWFDEEHLMLILGLMTVCLNALESLDITCYTRGKFIEHLLPHLPPFLRESRSISIDLSKAIRLKEMVFQTNS